MHPDAMIKIRALQILRFLLPVIIYDKIVRDTRNPRRKFSVFSVSALPYCLNCLDKGFLKYIIGYILILYYPENIIENAILMTLKKHIECFIASGCISLYQASLLCD